jgi:soluble lytic murein transglycosylase-like protein
MKYFFLRFCVWCKGRCSGKFDLQVMQIICAGWKQSTLPLAICLLAFSALPAQAGNQKEEAMADSVRLALAKAVSDSTPPKPTFANIEERIKYLNWQGEMATRLKRRIPDLQTRKELLDAIWYESKRAGLDVAMVMGLIQVESAFRKYATSVVGARGYMQVMPFWSRVIGDGDAKKLFQMQTNLRYGCSILRLYIDMEKGDLYLALGRYNGSRGRPEYPKAVLSNWKNWEFTS